MPSEMCAQAEKEREEPDAELQDCDLVTVLHLLTCVSLCAPLIPNLLQLFERCEPVERVEVTCADLAIFYDVHDLNGRLNSVGSMPVTAIQVTLQLYRMVIVMIFSCCRRNSSLSLCALAIPTS